MNAPTPIVSASWPDTLRRLALMLPATGAIVEVDRLVSAVPPSWPRVDDRRDVIVLPPLDYVRQMIERGLRIRWPDDVSPAAARYVAADNAEVRLAHDPLCFQAFDRARPLRGERLGDMLSGLREVAMLILGGQAVDAALVASSLAEIARLSPLIVLRSPAQDDNLPEVAAAIAAACDYIWLDADDLELPTANPRIAETIAIGVPSRYAVGPLRLALTPPRSIVAPQANPDAARPFSPAIRGSATWPHAYTIEASDLPATAGMSFIEQDGDTRWRWSIESNPVLYVEVPEPGEYRLSIRIRFFAPSSPRLLGLVVNGIRMPLIDGDHWVTSVRVPLFRHAIINLASAIVPAGGDDPRRLGFALAAIDVVRASDGG